MLNVRKALTLIEILIALLILTTGLATFFFSYRQFTLYHEKQQKLGDFYISILSLKSFIDSKIERGILTESGNFNGLHYKYEAIPIASKRRFNEETKTGFVYTLFNVKLTVNSREFNYDKFVWKRL